MGSTTYGTMNDPKGGVAKVTCRTFEAIGQIPMFHRTYFLLLPWSEIAKHFLKLFHVNVNFTCLIMQINFCLGVYSCLLVHSIEMKEYRLLL